VKTAKGNTATASKKQAFEHFKSESPTKLLDRFKGSKPEGGLPIFKFETAGTAIVASFIRRRPVTTKLGSGNVLDVDILECSDGKTTGPHSIFESSHVTRIFDSRDVVAGDQFFLKLHEIDPQSGFKRFSFEFVDPEKEKATSRKKPEQAPSADDDLPF
jgi:hypothetical protein